jgi:hypothetical protein
MGKAIRLHKEGVITLRYAAHTTIATMPGMVITTAFLESCFYDESIPVGFAAALSKRNKWDLSGPKQLWWMHVNFMVMYFGHEMLAHPQFDWPQHILDINVDDGTLTYLVANHHFRRNPVEFMVEIMGKTDIYAHDQRILLPGERIFLYTILVGAKLLRITESSSKLADFWRIMTRLPVELQSHLAMIAAANYSGVNVSNRIVAKHAYDRELCHWVAAQRLPNYRWPCIR